MKCGVRMMGILSLALMGCQSAERAPGTPTPVVGESPTISPESLYSRLGGEEAVRALASEIADKVVEKSTVNFDRDGMPEQWSNTPESLEQFKKGLGDWLVHHSGGPARYQGENLERVHDNMRISHTELNAFLAEAEGVMKARKLDKDLRREMLALLEQTRDDVVEAK